MTWGKAAWDAAALSHRRMFRQAVVAGKRATAALTGKELSRIQSGLGLKGQLSHSEMLNKIKQTVKRVTPLKPTQQKSQAHLKALLMIKHKFKK